MILQSLFADPGLWTKLHGGSTHFPIAMTMAGAMADTLGFCFRKPDWKASLHGAGYWMIVLGGLGAVPSVISGVLLTKGDLWGHGALLWHHIFAWMAFACVLCLAWWRARTGIIPSPFAMRFYLPGIAITAALMAGAGFWGGELISAGTSSPSSSAPNTASTSSPTQSTAEAATGPELVELGRRHYSQSCAHCHAEDASGDEGPPLRDLTMSNARIAKVIHDGIPGEMPAFHKKYNDKDIAALIAYLRTLKGSVTAK